MHGNLCMHTGCVLSASFRYWNFVLELVDLNGIWRYILRYPLHICRIQVLWYSLLAGVGVNWNNIMIASSTYLTFIWKLHLISHSACSTAGHCYSSHMVWLNMCIGMKSLASCWLKMEFWCLAMIMVCFHWLNK